MSAADEDTRRTIQSIEQSFGSLFRFVKANMHASAAQLDPELQPAAWSVLRHLLRESPVTGGALASALGVDKSVISRQLKDLREKGFVETTPSAEDARVSLVTPTESAIEKAGAIAEQAKNRYTDFLDTWSSEDLAEFARLLERFSHITDFHRGSVHAGSSCSARESAE